MTISICNNHKGVSTVIGTLLMITVVISFMSTIILIAQANMDMQFKILDANMQIYNDMLNHTVGNHSNLDNVTDDTLYIVCVNSTKYCIVSEMGYSFIVSSVEYIDIFQEMEP